MHTAHAKCVLFLDDPSLSTASLTRPNIMSVLRIVLLRMPRGEYKRLMRGFGSFKAETSWMTRLREKLEPYAQLGRFDKPVGTMLLFWPCAWVRPLRGIVMWDRMTCGLGSEPSNSHGSVSWSSNLCILCDWCSGHEISRMCDQWPLGSRFWPTGKEDEPMLPSSCWDDR